MGKKLYRSRDDRMVAGVCAGLAEYLEVDPTLIRAATLILALLTQGGVGLAYLVMAVVVPEEPVSEQPAPAVWPQQPAEVPAPAAEVITVSENETPATGPEAVPAPETVSAQPVTPAPAWTPPAPPKAEKRRSGGVGWGVVLIVLGLLLLAEEFTTIDVWRFWPVLIIALGVSAIIKGVRR